MNIVLIVPTGIGCEIGGHAGDANPVAKLMGACCDHLILHPNVVNSSDVNEMPENSWYVEGSCLDRFLKGELYLNRPKLNKILIAETAAAEDTDAVGYDPAASKLLVEDKCSQCHGIDLLEPSPPADQDEAHELVARMVDEGMEATADEIAQIVRYLTESYATTTE